MRGRDRSSHRFGPTETTKPYEPGDIVRNYAARKNWPLANNLLMVEGHLDVLYFRLASALYFQETNLELLGNSIAVFPPGLGEEGGTPGIVREFPTLRNNIRTDSPEGNDELFRLIVLLDHDYDGLWARNVLLSDKRLSEHRDVFCLHRRMPRRSRNPKEVSKHFSEANQSWKGLHCEIEDLVAKPILDEFIAENPSCINAKKTKVLADAYHYEFVTGVKNRLFEYVETWSQLSDLELIIEVLKSMRYYFGLLEDGDPPPV